MAYENGEIRPIYQQGETTQGGGIVIYTPERNNNASIATLNFTCKKNTSFSLYRFTSVTGKKILIYSFDLNAGDLVTDTVGYHLGSLSEKEGDYLLLVAYTGQIIYTIEGLEYEKNTIIPPFGRGGSVIILDKYGQQKVKCAGDTGYVYDCINSTITEETVEFQDDKLIGAKDLKFCIVDKQIFTEIDEDYELDDVLGKIIFSSITMYIDSTIVAPFNRKV